MAVATSSADLEAAVAAALDLASAAEAYTAMAGCGQAQRALVSGQSGGAGYALLPDGVLLVLLPERGARSGMVNTQLGRMVAAAGRETVD